MKLIFCFLSLVLLPVGAQAQIGYLNEELYPGTTVADRVNAAASSCGTAPCYIAIPPTAPAGTGWLTPPVNISIEDLRFFNGVGFASNVVPDFHYYHQYRLTAGANQVWELKPGTLNSGPWLMDLEAVASDGGFDHDGVHSNTGGMMIFTSRTGGSRPTWGLNINSQYSNLTNHIDALEIDLLNNSGTDDPGDGTVGIGINLVADSVTRNFVGPGILLGNSSNGGGWTTGIGINAYRDFGIRLSSSLTKQADIAISVPDAGTSKQSIYVTSSTPAAAQFAVYDSGDLVAQATRVLSLSAISGLTVGGGISITSSNDIVQAGFLVAGKAACIKATSPRTVGYCSTAVDATGSCTCN